MSRALRPAAELYYTAKEGEGKWKKTLHANTRARADEILKKKLLRDGKSIQTT